MRSPDPGLHELIQSMDKSEKRYFRLRSAFTRGSKNYLDLFNCIEGRRIYDEKRVKARLSGKTFSRYLAQEKRRLYDLLLGSQVEYRRYRLEYKGRYAVMKAAMLFEKGLLRQCETVLAKAHKECLEYEQFSILTEIWVWEYILTITSLSGKPDPLRLKNKQEEMNRYAGAVRNQMEYYHYNSVVVSLMNSIGIPRSPWEDKRWKEELIKAGYGKRSLPVTFDAQFYELFIRGNILFFRDFNAAASAGMYRRAFELFSERPRMKEIRFTNYYVALTSFIRACIQASEFEDARKAMSELQSIHDSLKERKQTQLATGTWYQLSILYSLEAGDYSSAATELRAAFRLHKQGSLVFRSRVAEVTMYYFGAALSLVEGQPHEALRHITRIFTGRNDAVRSDLMANIRIMQLLACYETGDEDLFASAFRSVYRYLLKGNQVHAFERFLLVTLRQASSGRFRNLKEKELFLKFHKKLSVILRDKYERRALRFFDYAEWLESKMTGEAFKTVLLKKKAGG